MINTDLKTAVMLHIECFEAKTISKSRPTNCINRCKQRSEPIRTYSLFDWRDLTSVHGLTSLFQNYIRVLTRPMAMAPKENITDHTVWTSVYLDALVST